MTQVSGRRSYEHTLWRIGLYNLACTCPEYRTHGPLCRPAASLLYVKRASVSCLTDADREADRLRCENQQLRNEVRRLERQVQSLEADLATRSEQWAALAERRLDGL